MGGIVAVSPLDAATVNTDSLAYDVGSQVGIEGRSFYAGETVRVVVTRLNGLALPVGSPATWEVVASGIPTDGSSSDGLVDRSLSGVGDLELDDFLTQWATVEGLIPGETLTVSASGQTSGIQASTSFLIVKTKFHQLQNGTPVDPEWSTGNINASNSCYAESAVVPYRFFALNMSAGSTHTFKLSFEATKNSLHAIDYLSEYDLTESGPIITVGGECSDVTADAPNDCATPTVAAALRDPRLASSYATAVPPELAAIINPAFPIDGPGNLYAYNATNVQVGQFNIAGTSSNRELYLIVSFTAVAQGSVGFFWGGHLSSGDPAGWGIGQGSGSISGAPFHMSAGELDGSGGMPDLSIQNGVVCLPPDVTLTCSGGPYCIDGTYTCSVPIGATDYTWTVTGGTILTGQGTNSITYKITALVGQPVTVHIDACKVIGSCYNESCCAENSVLFTASDCCEVSIFCPSDVTAGCDQSTNPTYTGTATFTTSGICPLPITISYTDTETAGTCSQEKTISRLWKATDANGQLRAQCTQIITVQDNTAPVLSNCPGPVTVQCNNIPAPATPNATDNCDLSPTITMSETTTPGSCPQQYTITRTWTATDDCGNSSQCSQVITVVDTQPPVITCPQWISVECLANVPVPNPALVSAVDNCDPSPTVVFVSDVSNGLTCPEKITRTYQATDACGNSATCTQMILVDDTTPPVVTCPADFTVECLDDVPAPNIALVSATDNCDASPVIAWLSDQVSGGTCPKIITRTYKAIDFCGNVGTCVQTITVDDTTPPVVTCPAGVTVECLAEVPVPNIALVSATDNCDPVPVKAWLSDDVSSGSCPKTITRTYTATDYCGNVGACTQIITVDDTTPPVIVCPPNTSITCGQSSDPSFTGYATATDNCTPTGSIVITYSDYQNGGGITRTWTATDECGNQASCQQFIGTPPDTTPPQITCPDDFSVECFADVPAPDPLLVTVFDPCDPTPVVVFVSDVQSGTSCPYTITRTYRATDASGNSATCGQTITIDDNVPPVLVGCPSNVTVECDAIPAPANVTATDNCAGVSVAFAEVETPGACAQEKTITRTWTATDFCGNQTSCSQVITVQDNTAPIITSCPGAISVQCVADIPVPSTSLVAATDNCDPGPVISFVNDVSDGQSCPETVTRTYKATDACGNFSYCTQMITVDDTIPPQITCPGGVTVECVGDVAAPNTALCAATDNCDPTPTVVWVSDTPQGSCPLTITRIYKATDDCGNEATCQQIIVVDDQTPPQLVGCPANISVSCSGIPGPAIVTATDNCPGVSVAFAEVTTAVSCEHAYTLTRTWTATDACGNEAQCQQIITVYDNTPPQITCPADFAVECYGDVPSPNPALCAATDNCDPAPTVTFVNDVPSGSVCPLTITRTYKATDACGNEATCQQVITVDDTTPPQIACPLGATVECIGDVPSPNPALCTATDNCDLNPTVVWVGDTPSGLCPTIVTRVYKATDDCGNEATCQQVFTVDDTTPPQITCPAGIAVECFSDIPQPNPALCSATDNCDATPTITFVSDVQSGSACPLTVTRTYKATDDCGNEATCQQIITVDDTTPPQLTCPTNIDAECGSIPQPNPALCSATDNCDPTPTITFVSDVQNGNGCPYTITRTYKATDDCGNEGFCQQTITVYDNTPPQIACPEEVVVECFGDVPPPNPAMCVATDNCDPSPTVTFVNNVQNGSGCPLTITRTYKAVDDCGNEAFCQQTITVYDQTPPVLADCPQNVTVDCGGLPPVATVTATDNCDGNVAVVFGEVTTPGNCVYNYLVTRTWTATDACGNVASCQQVITVQDVTPPEITCPGPVTVECMAEVPQPNPASCTATDNCDPNPAVMWVSDTPQGRCPATITRIYRAADACGNEAICTQIITVDDKTPPVFTVFPDPLEEPYVMCTPTEICIDLAAVDNCGGSVTMVSLRDGSIVGNRWCYTPTTSFSEWEVIEAWDTCGNGTILEFYIQVDINTPPEFTNCPQDARIHWGQSYSVDLDATDPDVGQPLTFSLCPGAPQGVTLNSTTGLLQFATTAADVCDPEVCVIVKDNCQVADTCEFSVCVYNDPPVITCPGDQLACYGYPFSTQVSATDPDHGPYLFYYLQSGPDGVTVDANTGAVNWPSPTPGSHDICVLATDSAHVCDPCSPSNSDTCCFELRVVSLDLVIEKEHDQIQGQFTEITIDFMHQGSNWPIAGYDLLIQYDNSALAFQKAVPGKFFTDCTWEYFTYRFGPSGNCGMGACPSGILRIVAMAESNGGNIGVHPDCYTNNGVADPGPSSTTSTEMAILTFLVSNDRTLECQFVPIRFIWYDCGDNALSNISGDTLFISNFVYDYSGEVGEPPVVQWNDITGLDGTFPTLTGAPSPDCDISDKFELVRCANFYNGGVDIVCADSIDAPGDINMNGIGYEIADAVMFTNYFITGMSAFGEHTEGSIAASDANRDGVSLSVSDLVYVIRVVVGDAQPYAKETPMAAVPVDYTFEDGVISVSGDVDMGGAALVVDGQVAPLLLADGMEMTYAFDGQVTRIVVTPPLDATSLRTFSGPLLSGLGGEIVSLEMATAEGAPVVAKNTPTHYWLSQNYPNPFNPSTRIGVGLKAAGDYTLTIFNVQGQVVEVVSGSAAGPERLEITWDATGLASGVYLYRLDAGQFTQTRKMLLLK